VGRGLVKDGQGKFFPAERGRCEKIDLVLFHGIPAKAGIQFFQGLKN
jgi:hypothetical protein